MKRRLAICIVAGVVLAWAGGAGAAILLYEPFDYTPVGSAVAGKGGTSDVGLAGTWTNAGSYPINVGTTSLAYPSSTGWTAATNGNDGVQTYMGSAGCDYTRNVTTSFGDVNGAGTIWWSYLVSNQGYARYNNTIRLSATGGALTVGWGGGGTSGTGTGKWVIGFPGGTVVGDGGVATAGNPSPILMVVRIDFSGNADPDAAYVFKNPGTTEPNISTAFSKVTGKNIGDVTAIGFHWNCNATYDEIKVATSYADLVPEPATMSVLALGGLACLAKRRRR